VKFFQQAVEKVSVSGRLWASVINNVQTYFLRASVSTTFGGLYAIPDFERLTQEFAHPQVFPRPEQERPDLIVGLE
jgi:hypothetical protein